MKSLRIVSFFLTLVISLPAFSAYESKDALIQEIMRAGFTSVVEVGAGLYSGLKFHRPGKMPIEVGNYVTENQSQRLPELDITTPALVRTTFDAYVVGDSLICYDFNNIRRRIEGHPRFNFCLIIPVPINEVLSKIKALPKPTESGAKPVPSTPANN